MAKLYELIILLFAVSVYSMQTKDRCTVKKFYGCLYFKAHDQCYCTTRRACNDPFKYKSESECMDDVKKLQGPCKKLPCINNGKCTAIKSHSKFVCDCTSTGFYGKRCHKACPRSSDLSLNWLQGFITHKHWQNTPLACIMG